MTLVVAKPDAGTIVDALVEHFSDGCAAARPLAFRIVVARLRDRYGAKVVDRALREYERALRQHQRALRRENRSLERQVARARADWMKRNAN
jgi:hypothetical protein